MSPNGVAPTPPHNSVYWWPASYAIVAGNTGLSSQRGVTFANGTIYIGEMNSGVVIAYAFPYVEANRPIPPVELLKVDFFQFREPN